MSYKSYSEYLSHPTFRAVCDVVKQRSGGTGGICETEGCNSQGVDMHHVRYCKWGEFDTPENLLHLCRECHEDAHTCRSCGGILKAEAIKADRDVCFDCYFRAG
jgi:hypothetical protein